MKTFNCSKYVSIIKHYFKGFIINHVHVICNTMVLNQYNPLCLILVVYHLKHLFFKDYPKQPHRELERVGNDIISLRLGQFDFLLTISVHFDLTIGQRQMPRVVKGFISCNNSRGCIGWQILFSLQQASQSKQNTSQKFFPLFLLSKCTRSIKGCQSYLFDPQHTLLILMQPQNYLEIIEI